MFQTSESCIKLHAVVVLELPVCVSTAPGMCVCVHLDGLNAENTFHCWLSSV